MQKIINFNYFQKINFSMNNLERHLNGPVSLIVKPDKFVSITSIFQKLQKVGFRNYQ